MAQRSPLASHTESEEQSRQSLEHYNELQLNIAILIAAARQDQWDHKKIADAFLALQRNANGIGRYLSCQIDPKFFNERRLPDSNVANKVLQIPELLELILLNLGPFDILNVASTCHGIKNIVNASSKLQVSLFQKPTSNIGTQNDTFQTPFGLFEFPGFTVDASFPDRPAQQGHIDAWFIFKEKRFTLPRVGSKIRSMFICQPAIKNMDVTVTCRAHNYTKDMTAVFSETGLTFQDLYNVAGYILRAEHFCPGCRVDTPDDKTDTKYPLTRRWTPTSIAFEAHPPHSFATSGAEAGGE